ncbi:MAG: family 10 glycosylhydrolase [Verrucomicrobia bacterium]|nr:family 10 glycosylhydrolase [Verrucomicrobiota bacterium]
MSIRFRIMLFGLFVLLLFHQPLHAQEFRALWVDCEGKNGTLQSKAKIVEMLDEAKRIGCTDLIVQVYRGNRSWFRSAKADTTPWREIKEAEGIDCLAFLVDEAHQRGLKLHAWFNIFRITTNTDAPMLKELGRAIALMDNHGRSVLDYKNFRIPPPIGNTYELSDEALMLDPGNLKVHAYQLAIVKEVLDNYPGVDGVHLDFVRYPSIMPFPPGSRFSWDIDFGYNPAALERFKAQTGLDARTMERSRANCQKWDDFRRENITRFVRATRKLIADSGKSVQLSAAGVAYADRAYLSFFQDWRGWCEEGLVDFVVAMNYTDDRRLARYLSRGAATVAGKAPAYVGLHAFISPVDADAVLAQLRDALDAGTRGICLFSYDTIRLQCPELFGKLAGSKGRPWGKD